MHAADVIPRFLQSREGFRARARVSGRAPMRIGLSGLIAEE